MLADNAESDLPTLVNLAPGEALDAYLERVADANYLTTARLIEMVRAGHGTTTAYLMLAPTPATLEADRSPHRSRRRRPAERDPGGLRRNEPRPARARPGPPVQLPHHRRPRLDPRPRHPDLPAMPRRRRHLAHHLAPAHHDRMPHPRHLPARHVPRLPAPLPRPAPLTLARSLVPRRCAATLSAKAHASNAASTSPRSPPSRPTMTASNAKPGKTPPTPAGQSPPSPASSPRPSSPPPSDP
jgi:hypothetical protein